jgi:transposase
MRRFGLRDDQWERIKHLLPGREGSVGVTAADNRLFVEAVLYRYRAGMPWRDLPERFGDGTKVLLRFSRWAKSGVWERVSQHPVRTEPRRKNDNRDRRKTASRSPPRR